MILPYSSPPGRARGDTSAVCVQNCACMTRTSAMSSRFRWLRACRLVAIACGSARCCLSAATPRLRDSKTLARARRERRRRRASTRRSARFAPVDIARRRRRAAAERAQALAKLVQRPRAHGRSVPAAGLGRQPGAAAAASRPTGRPKAAAELALLPHEQGTVVAARSRRSRSCGRSACRRSRRRRNFYPADATKEEVETWFDIAEGRRARRRRPASSPSIRRGAGRRASRRCPIPSSTRTSSSAAALLREAAALTDAADAQEVPRSCAPTLPLERLLRQRRRLDGARRVDRADHRPLRDLRRRVVRLQGGVRSVHHAARRCRDEEAGRSSARSCRGSRTRCRSIRSSATPKLGALAPIRVVNVVFTAGDGNRGVQTAAFNLPNDERVIREKGTKRVMLKNVQEAKFHKVLHADRQAWRSPPADQRQGVVRRVLHAHPDARADARPRSAPGHSATAGRRSVQELKETYARSRKPRRTSPASGRCSSSPTRAIVAADRADDVHDVPRVGIPIDPLRHQRGARHAASPCSSTTCSTRARSSSTPTARSASTTRRSARRVADLTRDIMTIQADGRLRRRAGAVEEDGRRSTGSSARARQAQGTCP